MLACFFLPTLIRARRYQEIDVLRSGEKGPYAASVFDLHGYEPEREPIIASQSSNPRQKALRELTARFLQRRLKDRFNTVALPLLEENVSTWASSFSMKRDVIRAAGRSDGQAAARLQQPLSHGELL